MRSSKSWNQRELIPYNKKYYLNYLYWVRGLCISPCPDNCGGIRFQPDPQAKCRGKKTCWKSKHIWSKDLIKWAWRYTEQCYTCGKHFVKFKKSDIFCSSECQELSDIKVECCGCGTKLKRHKAHKIQILTYPRTKGRRGWGDKWGWGSFHDWFCTYECAKKHKEELGYFQVV